MVNLKKTIALAFTVVAFSINNVSTEAKMSNEALNIFKVHKTMKAKKNIMML